MYMRKLSQQVITGYDKAVVRTTAGRLRGAIVEGTYIFRGVKYADAERFQLPTPVAPWDGVREALVYGYTCPELNTPIAHDAAYVPHYLWPQNENCQYLNIWTKCTSEEARMPVMVWLHGGGWFAGSSVELHAYDGENLAQYGDVVVVEINHRLNALGFLDLSQYGEKYRHSSLAGLADLVAALEWIQDNIAAFGGDPGNVTIMGQSGGGAKVLALLQTPAADGLFHKAVMQSGGVGASPNPNEKKRALRLAELTMQNLGLSQESISQIETMHFYDLAQGVSKAIKQLMEEEGGQRFPWGPVRDGQYYFGNPMEYGFRSESRHIPILAGSVFGEFLGNADIHFADGSKNEWESSLVERLYQEHFGCNADKALSCFRRAYPDKKDVDALFADKVCRQGFLDFTKARAAFASAPVYNFLFTFESDWDGGTVAWHNSEEPYMFHNAQYLESAYVPGVSELLQDQMTDAWVNFARSGDPNHRGIPHWAPVTADSVTTMIFDRTCRAAVDHDKDFLELIPLPKARKVFPGSGIMHAVYGADY